MSERLTLKVKSYDEIKLALFETMQERDVLQERLREVDKILGPQLDLLRIDRKREGYYKFTLPYPHIQRLRRCLSSEVTVKEKTT